MKANRSRTLVTVIGILLSAALFCSVTTLAMSIREYLIELNIYYGGDYYVKCHQIPGELAEQIRGDGELKTVAEAKVLGFVNLNGKESGMNTGVLSACNSDYFETMPVRLKEGRLPENSGEILLSAYWHGALPGFGMAADIGDTIAFEVIPYSQSLGVGTEGAEPVTREYTVVGVLADEFLYETFYSRANFQMLYTYDDGSVTGELYSDFYLKGHTPYASFRIAEKYRGTANGLLLSYYGAAQALSEQYLLLGGALVLLVIIMIGSSGLIHNAFSVSVSQRSKEYGLLSGIGATAKQLRGSMRREAWLLCALGIPVGLLVGYGAMAIAMGYVGRTIQQMVPLTASGVTLTARFHPVALLGAALIAVVTVFLSARKPMRYARQVTPIASIRQTEEYSHGKKGKRPEGHWREPQNISAAMAKKYYRVNRGKFRRVVFSLAMSIVIFLLAATVSESLKGLADSRIREENFDFLVMHPGGDEALLSAATDHSSILRKAGYDSASGQLALSERDFSEEKLEADEIIRSYSPESMDVQMVCIFYLEDAALREYLAEQKIDPGPYFREEAPLALVCQKELTTPYIQKEDGSWERYDLQFYPLSQEVTSVTVLEPNMPETLREYLKRLYTAEQVFFSGVYRRNEQGELLYEVQAELFVTEGNVGSLQEAGSHLFLVKTDESGTTDWFYPLENGKVSQLPAAEAEHSAYEIPLGARINEMPFGIPRDGDRSFCVQLILPLSALGGKAKAYGIQTQDYLATKNHLDSFAEKNVVYNDHMAEEYQSRSTAQMIDLFAYTFLLLITAISTANVFNTVSTNLVLRKRDFGILKSIGMGNGQLRRMVIAECCQSGWRALLWGMPLGIGLSAALNVLIGGTLGGGSGVPWMAVLVCLLSTGVTVGVSVVYALRVLKKDSPIEAIRTNTV